MKGGIITKLHLSPHLLARPLEGAAQTPPPILGPRLTRLSLAAEPAPPLCPCGFRLPQGLQDGAYYLVQYAWMVGMYCLFMAIFVLFGSLLGLKIFLRNSATLQLVFYFIWGNTLASWSLYFASMMDQTRVAGAMAGPALHARHACCRTGYP